MAKDANDQRVTLDRQLVGYWEREAARLDELSRRASFRWIARSYARKAARARGLAARGRAREIARGKAGAEAPRSA